MSSERLLILFLSLTSLWQIDCLKSRSDDLYMQIISRGLSSILWSEDSHFQADISTLSGNCSSALQYIHDGIHRTGSSKAYEMLDYSSKTPSGILEGTTASFGDYDGCLSLKFDGAHGFGQYCTVTVALKDPGNSSSIGSLYYSSLPYLGAFDLSFGLCFPSACTRDEVEAFVVARTSRYPLALSSYKELPLDFDTPITCELLEEKTWLYRLKNLTTSQILSIIWLSVFPTIVVISSFLTLVGVKGRLNDFSAQTTIRKFLSYQEPTDTVVFLVESMRAQVIIGGFMGHSILPVEKMQAIQFIEAPNVYATFTGTWFAQPWNDGLLGLIPWVSGYVCYKFYSSKIQSSSFSACRTVLNRYLRVAFAVSIAIAFEFIFPLFGDGPIFKILAQRFTSDCDSNWWKHFVLDAHSSGTRSCAIHMFFGSMEVKLLAIGLIVLWIFKRYNARAFLTVSGFITVASCVLMHEQVKHLNLPTFLSNPADLKLISESFYATHFIISYYLPGFMVGLLTAYVIENNILFYKPTMTNWLIHFAFSLLWSPLVGFTPALHNILRVVPRWAYGIFIVVHRMMYFSAFSINALLIPHYNGPLTLKMMPLFLKKLFIYINRIAMSFHLVNLLYIRFHFLTIRQLESIRPFDLIMRWTFSAYFIVIFALITEVMIISPMQALVPKSEIARATKKDE